MTRAPDSVTVTDTLAGIEKSINWLEPDLGTFANYLSWRRLSLSVQEAVQTDHDAQMKLVGKMEILRELISLIDDNRAAAKRRE
jgi:hypothetical protein